VNVDVVVTKTSGPPRLGGIDICARRGVSLELRHLESMCLGVLDRRTTEVSPDRDEVGDFKLKTASGKGVSSSRPPSVHAGVRPSRMTSCSRSVAAMSALLVKGFVPETPTRLGALALPNRSADIFDLGLRYPLIRKQVQKPLPDPRTRLAPIDHRQ
jgi:hypothetical protein